MRAYDHNARGPVALLWLVLVVFVGGCALMEPYTPPTGSQAYPGKDTAYILPEQPAPEQHRLNLLFFEYEWWTGNPVPFRTLWFSPLTVFTCASLGCAHVYDGVKIDGTYTQEGWDVYHVLPLRYVYEFRGMYDSDDHSEQFALGWHRQVPCSWKVMARC